MFYPHFQAKKRPKAVTMPFLSFRYICQPLKPSQLKKDVTLQRMKYSVIIPVYNRPDEAQELLESLTQQTCQDFEVIVVEDGSSVPCKAVGKGICLENGS